MAKKALLDVLEQTIGKYVKNLDAESLNVAVWSGKIELHSLQLDVAAVNSELDRQAAESPNLAIPVKVVSGSFESLQVDVPWAQLMSRSVVMTAKGLNVSVEPYDRLSQADHLQAVVANEAKRAERTREARKQSLSQSDKYRLQANAMRRLAQADLENGDSTSQSTSSSFGSRLVRRIIENIQVEVSDVHVCLNDSDGSAGVVLESLSLVTTDKTGRRSFVDRTAASKTEDNTFLYKALQITGFGVYLNQTEKSYTPLVPINEGGPSEAADPPHSYILAPLSFEASLRQADGKVCIDYAKYLLSSELSSLSILLSRSQLDFARKISRKVVNDNVGPLFPEYRPLTRVTKETAAEWWKYAFRCLGRLNGKSSWVEFLRAFRLRKTYIPLYKRHAHHASCAWMTALTAPEMEELERIEQDRSISAEGIMTWRNIADGQMEKEREKHVAKQANKERSSLFSSIFGSREKAAVKSDDDEPPIHLSVDELKELEDMSMLDFADEELSKESKLYDVKFVLSSLKINLTAYDLQHIAALDMGTVSVDFNAGADGAYVFNFNLASADVRDMTTPSTLFPRVLRSANSHEHGKTLPAFEDVFKVHVEKTKTGDQKLLVRLAEFEMIASPILIREVKRFFSETSFTIEYNQNPILAQSLSGSVDLFYDADTGRLPTPRAEKVEQRSSPASLPSSELSNVLIDAWHAKTETKASWVIDVDIDAPVIIIPEKCSDPRAKVLMFDLGRFKLQYGKIKPSKKVEGWLLENPRHATGDLMLDSGSLEICELTFMVGNADCWYSPQREASSAHRGGKDAVVEPISISLAFGIESTTGEDVPRVCGFAMIPTISLRLSPIQGSTILSIVQTWSDFLNELNGGTEQQEPFPTEIPAHGNTWGSGVRQIDLQSTEERKTRDPGSVHGAHPMFHLVIGLQRLSITAVTNEGDSIEAHLVSVYASTSSLSDGSSVSQLRMGWFWVLDQLQGEFIRRQRLVAHSNLPLSPESCAREDKYAILETLTAQGVFESDYAGSSELADVTMQKLPSSNSLDPSGHCGEEVAGSTLNINFSSLFVHWNPHAVKAFSRMIEKFTSVAEEHTGLTERALLITSPEKASTPKATSVAQQARPRDTRKNGKMVVRARMERLDINLNSALDDHPLFVLTMSCAQVNLEFSQSVDQSMVASLGLGDVRIRTPEMGQTKAAYRTLLGLAPGRSDSLLTVKYCVGARAIGAMSLPSVDTSRLEACAEVDLSPMRFVYIHSQIMAAVEYITEGVLGALTAQAASSAAEAAKEIANSVAGEKFFVVKATSFEMILPQSAITEPVISIHAGSLSVGYRMFPDPGGGEALISLSEVSLKGNLGKEMQEKPIRMDIVVKLPPDEVGTYDDQAMRVDLKASQATFIVSTAQYAQILGTLSNNMGDSELYLRDGETLAAKEQPIVDDKECLSLVDPAHADITHAGVAAVVRLRRMYLRVEVSVLALELCGSDILDPIIRIAAVNCGVGLDQIPDEEMMSCNVSLGNLVCSDRRAKASSRQYRSLIDHIGDGIDKTEDFFYVEYRAMRDVSHVELKIGRPQIVLIPDAISDVLRFLRGGGDNTAVDRERPIQAATEREVIRVDSELSGENVETSIHSTSRGTDSTKMHISLKTDKCRLILVDLGSQYSSFESIASGKASPLAETIVVQGMFSASLSITSDSKSNEMISADLQSQADAMEVFSAFGRDMRSPLQILDPAEFSAHGSLKATDAGETQVELRAAALTPFEVVFSMHNAALLNAILNGLQESFSTELGEEADESRQALSAAEKQRVEELATALGAVHSNESIVSRRLSSIDETSKALSRADSLRASSSLRVEVKLTMPETRVTVINDLQGLDEALFRVTVANFVAGGHMNNKGLTRDTTFDFHLNTSILADYFDSSLNLWNVLLIKPWEITLKGIRAPSARFKSKRLSTTIDLESFPCSISFSEQFLASLAGAKRMWSIYAAATSNPIVVEAGRSSFVDHTDASLKRSMAASAARNLVTSLPYAIENHSGVDATFLLPGPRQDCQKCANGTLTYFRFEPPRGKGFGGYRLYGQDYIQEKSVTLFLQDAMVQIGHLDAELGLPWSAHELTDGRVLLTNVSKEGKTIVLHLTSYVEIHNRTTLPFMVSALLGDKRVQVGVCSENGYPSDAKKARRVSSLIVSDGSVSKESRRFSVPLELMRPFVNEWKSNGRSKFSLAISPLTCGDSFADGNPSLEGTMYVEPSLEELENAEGILQAAFDITCRTTGGNNPKSEDPFVVHVLVQMTLVGENHLSLGIFLEPRAVIVNQMPVGIHLRTPMPHTFSLSDKEEASGRHITYKLQPEARVEVFTPGPSIAVTAKTSDMPVAGSTLGWMDGGWMDLPLASEFSLPEPLFCTFPFSNQQNPNPLVPAGRRGSEFIIAEGLESLAGLASFRVAKNEQNQSSPVSSEEVGVEMCAPNSMGELAKKFFFTVCYYAVDHTGDLLFEQVVESTGGLRRNVASSQDSRRRSSTAVISEPLSAFASTRLRRRITLLSSEVPLRLLQLTMDGDEGVNRSLPFLIEEIPIGKGGVDCMPLHWENKEPSGYYAYRTLLNEHQSEVHVIPEYIVFNGSTDVVLVREKGRPEIIIEAGQVASLRASSRPRGLELSFSFIEYGCRSPVLPVADLGLKVTLVKSQSGSPIGSVCVQTVIDTQGDSRLVVKIGEVKFGSIAPERHSQPSGLLANDFVRFRVRWTQLVVTLNEAQKLLRSRAKLEDGLEATQIDSPPSSLTRSAKMAFDRAIPGMRDIRRFQQPVTTIVFSRFTVDYQRIFKDEVKSNSQQSTTHASPERSQLSVIVHNLQIKDETPETPFPVVFDCSSEISFMDLCIRVRGPSDADLIKVDLFDLNLAHLNGKSNKIVLNTSEEFVWKLLDLSNRIADASGELSELSLKLEEDKAHGGYVVSMVDKNLRPSDEVKYTPPQSDKLYDINLARVSPFTLLLSFRRRPQASRYKYVRGGNLMKYFTQRLKFTIDKAELRFARYEDKTLRGPHDRLIESLCAVYISRMKLKLLTLVTAASFQDWKYLASRDDGDDDFVEGDILRATGNLAGSTAGMIFKKVGKGIESGVSGISHSLGNTIEKSAGKVGAGKLGVGVNSVVSGVGDGVGETISGVGAGAGKVLKGAGQGIGHVVGGVTGGALLVGKGIGKGIVTGDGRAVVSGLAKGASSVGGGVNQGVESAVMGAADGVLSAGHGLFSGLKTVGRGIGGAFKGKKPEKRRSKPG